MSHLEKLNAQTPDGLYRLKTTSGTYEVRLAKDNNVLTRIDREPQQFKILQVEATIGKRAVFQLPSDKGLENTMTTAPLVAITILEN